MAMVAKLSATSEDKDVLIQRANKALTRAGFAPLFRAHDLTRGELKDAIQKASLMNAFTSRDAIVLHFNRYNPDLKHQFTDHVATHKFPTPAVAKAFIEATIREAWERVPTPSKKWLGPNRFALNDWIIITANGPTSLEDIMEAKVPAKYSLPAPYDYYAEQIMAYHWGIHPQVNSRSRAAHNQPPLTDKEKERFTPPSRIRQSNERIVTPSRSQNKAPTRQSKTPAARAPKTGLISLDAICTSLKINSKEARQALRDISYPKPGSRWEWPSEQTDKVTKDIKSAIEKARKK